jgi:hypothetical protein
MPGPCSGKIFISILVTDCIQKALLFSFEYNLVPTLISNFNHYMDTALMYEKTNETHALTFLSLNILELLGVPYLTHFI